MPRFISGTYHASIKVAEFICDDGRHLLRCGGTLPWRLNNAGDLMSPLDINNQPAPKKTKNFIGFAQVTTIGSSPIATEQVGDKFRSREKMASRCSAKTGSL